MAKVQRKTLSALKLYGFATLISAILGYHYTQGGNSFLIGMLYLCVILSGFQFGRALSNALIEKGQTEKEQSPDFQGDKK